MEGNKVNRFGLTDRDMDTITKILKNYPEITEVHIFGSRVKGNNKPGSDIDLAILNAGVSEKTVRSLRAEFEESSLPFRVDIVDFNSTNHAGLKDHIQRVGVVFYKRKTESPL